MAKPTKIPTWATDGGAAVTEPSTGKKATGWIVERPAYQYFNWLLRTIGEWLGFVDTQFAADGVKRVHDAVDLAALKALTPADGDVARIVASVFVFAAGDTTTADDVLVITPDVTAGRWLHVAQAAVGVANGIAGLGANKEISATSTSGTAVTGTATSGGAHGVEGYGHGTGAGVVGTATADNANGVEGTGHGTGAGVKGTGVVGVTGVSTDVAGAGVTGAGATGGVAIQGNAFGTSSMGVVGVCVSGDGTGVAGAATGGGTGKLGIFDGTGVEGTGAGAGVGVKGTGGATGIGVYGYSSSDAAGVEGLVDGGTGSAVGVRGTFDGGGGDTATGELGCADGGTGVIGTGASSGSGVVGYSTLNHAVRGDSLGAGAGVHGQSATGPGGMFLANADRGAINIAYAGTPTGGEVGDLVFDTTVPALKVCISVGPVVWATVTTS